LEFAREPTPAHLAIAAATVGNASLAALVFHIGLRRYQRRQTPISGS
jgi:hypothetical protein